MGAEVEEAGWLSQVLEDLKAAPWYWGALRRKDAERALAGTAPGTFLLRDSRSQHYIFALSVVTEAGVEHAHVPLNTGRFILGAASSAAQLRSADLVDLIHSAAAPRHVLSLHSKLERESGGTPFHLTRPLPRHALLPSLKHLARFVVLQRLPSLSHLHSLPLPPNLKHYLRDPNYIAELS